MSQDLEQRLQAGDTDATSVIVTGSSERIARMAARHGLRVAKLLETGAVLEVPAGTLERGGQRQRGRSAVEQSPGRSAHGRDQPDDRRGPGAGRAAGRRASVALTGAGIGVAVIDTGVAPMPELRGRIIASQDFTDERGLGLDEHGHGTHVAGIIAASGANRFDETRGVAPGANIISLKVLDAQGKGLAANVIEAIDWAVAEPRAATTSASSTCRSAAR